MYIRLSGNRETPYDNRDDAIRSLRRGDILIAHGPLTPANRREIKRKKATVK